MRELKSRGYEAYDTDDDGFARWRNDKTGYIYPKSSVKKEDRTEDFLKTHSWQVPRREIEELAKKANDHAIFLCGVASNENQIGDLFKTVFELTIDDETLIRRLLTRTNNDWGKQPHELQHSLAEQHNNAGLGRKFVRISIDATKPLQTVVGEILKIVESA